MIKAVVEYREGKRGVKVDASGDSCDIFDEIFNLVCELMRDSKLQFLLAEALNAAVKELEHDKNNLSN